jgi:hypothetical protein
MERNLLTWIETTPPDDEQRLASLHETLDEVRTTKAKYELRLSSQITTQLQISPQTPGVSITPLPDAITSALDCEKQRETRKQETWSGV